jgi:hypothetical protein
MAIAVTGTVPPENERMLWWARTRPEDAVWPDSCPECGEEIASPIDLYCAGAASHPLFLSGSAKRRLFLVWAARTLLAGLAILAAGRKTAVPLEVGIFLVGVLLVAVPLRRFRTGRLAGTIAWAGSFLVVAIAQHAGLSGMTDYAIVLGVVVSAFVSLVVAVGFDADAVRDIACRALSVGAALTFSFGVLALVTWIRSPDPFVLKIFVLATVVFGFGTLGVAAVVGLIRGRRRTTYSPAFAAPVWRVPPRVRDPFEPRRGTDRGYASHLIFGFQRFAFKLAWHSARLARLVLRALWRGMNTLIRAFSKTWYVIRVAWIRFIRTLGAGAVDATRAIADAVRVVLRVAARWLESAVLPMAMITVAAVAGVLASVHFAHYLARGRIGEGVFALAAWLVVASLLVASWGPLTGMTRSQVRPAAKRFFEDLSAPVLFTGVVIGWADGLAGVLGFGPIRPGWFTISGSIGIAAVLAYAWRNRASEESPSGAHASGGVV